MSKVASKLVIGPELLHRLLGAENVTRKYIYCLVTFWKMSVVLPYPAKGFSQSEYGYVQEKPRLCNGVPWPLRLVHLKFPILFTGIPVLNASVSDFTGSFKSRTNIRVFTSERINEDLSRSPDSTLLINTLWDLWWPGCIGLYGFHAVIVWERVRARGAAGFMSRILVMMVLLPPRPDEISDRMEYDSWNFSVRRRATKLSLRISQDRWFS
ncbi:hypothetical protein IW262DRAFT_1291155 [Armillaria fumosa]|nr:hypothetical protein IW262DRAFT_1291155 [Armillaria fumosa]